MGASAQRPVVRVCAAIVRDDAILVRHVHDGEDYWTLPGGGVEAGETLEQAVIRVRGASTCPKGVHRDRALRAWPRVCSDRRHPDPNRYTEPNHSRSVSARAARARRYVPGVIAAT
jgi:hypothetical protein